MDTYEEMAFFTLIGLVVVIVIGSLSSWRDCSCLTAAEAVRTQLQTAIDDLQTAIGELRALTWTLEPIIRLAIEREFDDMREQVRELSNHN